MTNTTNTDLLKTGLLDHCVILVKLTLLLVTTPWPWSWLTLTLALGLIMALLASLVSAHNDDGVC